MAKDTKERILMAALDLFSKKGYEGANIYEHMDADEATDVFLKESGMTAPAGVGYCLAVRK